MTAKVRILLRLVSALFVLIVLSPGCSESPTHSNPPDAQHTALLDGHWHRPDFCHPLESCAACHGADLRGGAGPSCYKCHGEKWNANECR